jgi:putative transposase
VFSRHIPVASDASGPTLSQWTGLPWVWVAPGQEPPTIPSGFHVLPRRWVVERTFAWLVTYRRLSKDFEELPETSEALIYIAMSRLMVKRLAS